MRVNILEVNVNYSKSKPGYEQNASLVYYYFFVQKKKNTRKLCFLGHLMVKILEVKTKLLFLQLIKMSIIIQSPLFHYPRIN